MESFASKDLNPLMNYKLFKGQTKVTGVFSNALDILYAHIGAAFGVYGQMSSSNPYLLQAIPSKDENVLLYSATSNYLRR